PDTLGVIMPCGSAVNYGSDTDDALALARQFDIETVTVDLTGVKELLLNSLSVRDSMAARADSAPASAAAINIAPRLRMAALYAIAASERRLVAGTGNKSELYMGYFTKWGDGACDFNPIADLTATEVLEFLRYLNAPRAITAKAPSAGLFEGQTDESDMGVTYAAIDRYIGSGKTAVGGAERAVIERFHAASSHKRRPPAIVE
ncbi:MAG: NAD(+) synthase, partial [Oscillospiraceae bacterium]|nr:NAD(+) synthase [Oscillospiraceae bacterium]